jgi:hypothetical protein
VRGGGQMWQCWHLLNIYKPQKYYYKGIRTT